MSQKEINKLIGLAQERKRKKVSKKEALSTFVLAGILNDKAKFTKPYEHLETVVVRK